MRDDPLNRLKVLRGEQLPHAKLTEEDVRWIRRMVERRERLRRLASQLSNANLARRLGVHYRTVDRVTADENWTHVA